MSAQQVHTTAKRGDLEAVRQMVKANPSLKEDTSFDDLTPLNLAAYQGEVGIVRFLVGEGVDKDKASVNGWTPLYWSAMQGHLDVVRYLAGEAGVDKDKASVNGWTPLMTASEWNGYLEVARFLLEEGANVTLKNKYGNTALTLAEKNDRVEVAALLREYLPGGIMYQRRDAVINVVLEQDDLGPDVARFCGDFVMNRT